MSAHGDSKAMKNQTSLLRASSGLMFFSSLVFASGIQRAQIYTFFLSAGTLVSFPPSALLLGALMEVTMGLIGFAFGAAAMLSYKVPSLLAWIVFGTLEIFAWYVFLIFVFIQPGMDAAAIATPEPWTSRMLFNTFVMSGILTAAFYCATLFGGILSFAWYMLHLYASPSEDIGQDPNYWTRRARYYSTLVLLTGIFILVAGCTATAVDPGPHAIAAPPVFIIWSGLPIATGAFAILTGGVGLIVGLMEPHQNASLVVLVLTVINCLWQIAIMSLYQPPAQGNFVAALPIAILIISQLLPAYFHLMRPRISIVLSSNAPSNEVIRHDNQTDHDFSNSAIPLNEKL